MAYREIDMLPIRAFRARFGRLETLEGKDSAEAPDYTPVANASKEAAEISAKLGGEQLAENKRQYDQNMAVAQPIVNAQGQLMDQAYAQGNQNYQAFQTEGRPVQQTMLYDALGLSADEIAQYNKLRAQETSTANAGRAAQTDKLTAALSSMKSGSGLSDAERQELVGMLSSSGSSSPLGIVNSNGTVTSYNDSKALAASMRASLQKQQNSLIAMNPDSSEFARWNSGGDRMTASRAKNMSDDELLAWGKEAGIVSGGSAFSDADQTRLSELLGKTTSGTTLDSTAIKSIAGLTDYTTDNSESSNYLAQVSAASKQRQMDEAADLSLADARTGTTQQMNQLMRQGMRYGWSPSKLASIGGLAATSGAQQQVASANSARTQADAKRTAKLGDVYNTYAGLGSSAPSFYGAGTSAGNSAVQNQLGTSGQYLSGQSSGNSTIMQGQGMQLSGLGNVMNTQAGIYGQQTASNNSAMSGLGSLVGMGLGAYSMFK